MSYIHDKELLPEVREILKKRDFVSKKKYMVFGLYCKGDLEEDDDYKKIMKYLKRYERKWEKEELELEDQLKKIRETCVHKWKDMDPD